MSSIRPLVTITVLAFVGVFLYLKINETEPPLPAGVEDWSANTDIQFDMGGSGSDAMPSFDMAGGADAPPSFSADAASAPGVAAPAFQPSPPTNTPPPVAASNAPAFQPNPDEVAAAGPETEMPALPDLPPMPTLPPAPSTAPSSSTAPAADMAMQTESGPAAQPPAPNAPARSGLIPPTTSPPTNTAQAQSSLFSATRLAVQAALDRGELSQALLLLSNWYGDPSLSPEETAEVNTLLGQLAGSVIYSTEHRLAPPYMVKAGERLETIAKEYDVPWQLLAKINGITSADQLQPGQELKVIRGPFSAIIDINQRKMTLMLERRYAGRFVLDVDPSVTVEEGHWEVDQKLLTPANADVAGAGPTTLTEERSLMLSNASGDVSQVAILRGAVASNPLTDPTDRVLRLNPTDAEDVFDILSVGSKVVIRR